MGTIPIEGKYEHFCMILYYYIDERNQTITGVRPFPDTIPFIMSVFSQTRQDLTPLQPQFFGCFTDAMPQPDPKTFTIYCCLHLRNPMQRATVSHL